jgi:hypothetical protein
MKERPILFSAPMVRALLDGMKTQTRRIADDFIGFAGSGQPLTVRGGSPCEYVCPYGQPGDRLWVREAWKAHSVFDNVPPRDIPKTCVWYPADSGYMPGSRARPSIHMPRWASRITLEIVSVRVERLQDISEADALAEGVSDTGSMITGDGANEISGPIAEYAVLWESINGHRSWEANPWVWVVEFKRVEGGAA